MAAEKRMKKQAQKKNYWNSNLTGLMRVYAHEVPCKKGKPTTFLKYSTSLGVKNEDGEWDNFYLNVRFMKGDSPEADDGECIEIEIEKAFLTFEAYRTKSGNEIKTPVVVVQEWAGREQDFDDDDIPF